MRLVHSSDLQIGKAFGVFDSDIANLLQDARQRAVRSLGEAATRHGASAVLLAGDVYDKQQISRVTLAKPIETMRAFPQLAWHIMPGNHDHLRENGLWDRLRRMSLPPNVHLHTREGAVRIAEDAGVPVYLLPAPLRQISSADDLTAYMDSAPTPDGAVRIGMAHGSIQGFGSEGEASNYVAPTRADSAALAYLAMGDWHRQIRISDRVWYCGTPEPDRFKLPPSEAGTLCNGGSALLVDIAGPRTVPSVTSIETGRYRWHLLERTVLEDGQLEPLAAELRSLEPDLSRAVVHLRVRGTLSLGGLADFEELIGQGVRAAFCALRIEDEGLTLEPTEDDLDSIDRSGFVRVAAERLKAMSGDPAQARLAGLALKRLFIEQARAEGEP
jgi:DNA repair exonuclease SbcCD nuclease subunit